MAQNRWRCSNHEITWDRDVSEEDESASSDEESAGDSGSESESQVPNTEDQEMVDTDSDGAL